jgi:glucose/arabinose dehydrogenase
MLRFGPDGKLYIFFGDQGRRGQLQNLPDGPFGPGQPDDQFGGPEPDNAHLNGVILRLNDDGTAPGNNPFFKFGASVGGEVGANIQKIFSYGHRNSFGTAFDPFSGKTVASGERRRQFLRT